MIDYEKRKRIMGRSLKLGHCVCNPKEDCPCELFKKKNICLCSGEREDEALEDVPLTSLVENAGCASKIGQEDLKRALSGLPRILDPAVLVSSETCDDAGVYRIDDERALVQTVDVFTPVVDDPYVFGEIAAANSVSDVYAMGGRPLTALAVVAFPIETLSARIMNRMLQGGFDKLREADTVVIGGHSIKDREIKFGFAVTGIVHPDRIVTNASAEPGQVLILTKPIGTGILSFASQIGRSRPEWLEATARSMASLNRTAAEVMIKAGVRCATDVTGFGLIGHSGEIARQSGVDIELRAEAVPLFEGVRECVREGLIPGGVERNRESAAGILERDPDVGEDLESILCDPQTSGGLLMCVAPERAGDLLRALHDQGIRAATVIGRITGRSDGRIRLKP
jgi:selenide, water dikinase